MPDSVTEIGPYAFAECTSLQSIEIPDSVTKVGVHAFDGCTSLKSITAPISLKDNLTGSDGPGIPEGVEIIWK